MPPSNIFTVASEDLGRFGSNEAVEFVSQLLWAESLRIGLPTTHINITRRINVKDGGIDATIQPHSSADFSKSFLPTGLVGLQIKAGTTFKPTEAQIRKELFDDAAVSREALGQSVRTCLDGDGTYVLVCTGIDPTEPERQEATTRLQAFLGQCGYNNPKAEVWGQNQLIGLLSRFPSLALWVNGKGMAEFQTHASWSSHFEMRRGLKMGRLQEEFVIALQTQLRKPGSAVHIRIRGEAGIGKTRLVLEATRADDLKPMVVYCDGPDRFLTGQLLNELLRDDNEFCVIAVVDECDLKSRTSIWNQLSSKGDRVKLVTVYNDIDEPSGTTAVLDAPPLEAADTSALIQQYDVPSDQASRWAEYCDGSPRVAHVIGQNLKNNPENILKQPDTVDIWGRYIAGSEDVESAAAQERRLVLRYLSLFKRFGYGGPVTKEAESISKLIYENNPSITWPRFQEIVKTLRDRKILQGETTLYITPKLLHIKVWAEWFENYGIGFDVGAFEAKLASPELVDWFREMYQFARESRESMAVVKKLLDESGPFGSADFFQQRRSAEFFLRLTDAAPDSALKRLEETIGKWDVDRLKAFEEGRRQVVWALERIAVWRDLFPGAAALLLKLAEAENENIGNNATGVFADLFSPGNGPVAPTEAPPEERYPILERALVSDSVAQRTIALKAADHALETGHFSRATGAEYQGLRRPPQLWVPSTWGELFDAYRRVWRLLENRLEALQGSERQEAVRILLSNARGLAKMANLAPMVIGTLTTLWSKPWMDRRQIIDTVEDIYRYDASDFDPKVRPQWDALRALLTPVDFDSRLERYVGMDRWADSINEDKQQTDRVEKLITELAQEAFADQTLLTRALPWLVTGRAKNGYRFGYDLGRLDTSTTLATPIATALRAAEKPDVFFLGGYLRAVSERSADQSEQLLDEFAADEGMRSLVPELTFRSGLTDRGALRLVSLLQSRSIEAWRLRVLAFGGVIRNLSEPIFHVLVHELVEMNTDQSVGTAVDLYHFYYLMGDSHLPMPRDLTSRLLTADAFFRSPEESTTNLSREYDWNEVAEEFVRLYPDDALPLGRKLLEHFGEERSVIGGFRSEAQKVLERILRSHPKELWADIELYLTPPLDSRAFRIRHWLRGGAMLAIPADLVWKWIEQNVELRAWYAATLIPASFPGDPASCSARELLVRYGNREDVRRNLQANFSSEAWWGPESRHLQGKLDWLRGLLQTETNPNVRLWLSEYESTIQARLERARVEEERERH